jgi:hypothetical protein
MGDDTAPDGAPEAGVAAEADEWDDEEAEAAEDEDEEELPAFLGGDGWTMRERAHAYALYLGLPAGLQPTVAARVGGVAQGSGGGEIVAPGASLAVC